MRGVFVQIIACVGLLVGSLQAQVVPTTMQEGEGGEAVRVTLYRAVEEAVDTLTADVPVPPVLYVSPSINTLAQEGYALIAVPSMRCHPQEDQEPSGPPMAVVSPPPDAVAIQAVCRTVTCGGPGAAWSMPTVGLLSATPPWRPQ
jgi:hypothetical protein